MIYPNFKYVDVAYGGPQHRNNIKILPNLDIPRDVSDCYRTVYRYPEEFHSYFKKHKTVSGYTGPAYADFLPVDIDNKDLEEAHKTAKMFLNHLLHNYEVDLNGLYIFFSGAKGFHILLPDALFGLRPSEHLPQAFKIMAPRLAEGIKIDTVIYDHVRLFRLSNTKHSKTGLYKVQLTAAEVIHKNIDEIKQFATAPRRVETEPADSINEYLREAYLQALEEVEKPKKERAITTPGGIVPPKNAKLCYYKILEGVGEGQRDNAGLRLGVHLLKQYPPDIVLPMLHAWNNRNTPPLDAADIEKLWKQAQGSYDFGCRDAVLAEFCSPGCIYKGRSEGRVSADRIYTLDEAKDRYFDYIQKLEQRKIMLGFKKLDINLRGIAPGEVCQVMARTGVGKTAFLLNVISHVIVNQKIPVLFFSLEQPLAQIYERAVQISLGMEGREVEMVFKKKSNETDFIKQMHKNVGLNYDKLFVVEEDFLTYEELRDFILLAEEEKIYSRPPLVCIDYLGRMKGGRGTAYEITSELARLLKALAKELDLAVLYLHQTSRVGGTGAEPLTVDMGRESGVTEEAADFVLGMWRPEINKPEAQERDWERLEIAILKNRKGRMGQASYKFMKPQLQIVDWEQDTRGVAR